MILEMKNINSLFSAIGETITRELPFFILCLLLISIPAGYQLGIDAFSYSLPLFLSSMLQSVPIVLCCCIAVRYISKYFRYIIIFSFLALFIIETFAFFQFNQRMSPLIMSLILQTDLTEIRNFFIAFVFNLRCAVILILLILFSFLYIKICSLWKQCQYRFYIFTGISILVLTVLGLYQTTLSFRTMDTNTSLNSICQFAYSFYQVNRHKGSVDDIYDANNRIVITSTLEKAPVIICVIGESFIKRHSSLYGYPLNTNPNLEKEKENGNLFVFNDVVTPFPSTNANMEMIYSIKSADDTTIWAKQPLFPAIFKKAGFKVALLDFQFARSRSGYMFEYHCSYFINPTRIHEQCFDFRNDSIFQHDGDGLDTYINCLYHHSKALNIIHLQGQHVPTKAHFPQTTQWQKIDREDINRPDLDAEQRSLVANYDNCTIYNDNILKRIIDQFRKEDAVIVYFTDHGEQVFDDWHKIYGRTFGQFSKERIKCIYEIPFVIWVSDDFKTNHPDLLKNISESVNKPYSNDDVSFLLFDLAGINFQGNKPDRSVINPNFKTHERILIEGDKKYNYDQHKKELDKVKMLVPNTIH